MLPGEDFSDTLSAGRRRQLLVLDGFQHLPRTRANGDALRQIHPTDGARGVDEEFGGTRDVRAVRSAAFVQEVVTLDHFGLRVAEERIGETELLRVLPRDVRRVNADGNDADAAGVEVGKALLETP